MWVYKDFNLIINQILQKCKVRSEALAPYQAHLVDLTKNFTHVSYNYPSREDNLFADTLAILASMINIPNGTIWSN